MLAEDVPKNQLSGEENEFPSQPWESCLGFLSQGIFESMGNSGVEEEQRRREKETLGKEKGEKEAPSAPTEGRVRGNFAQEMNTFRLEVSDVAV